MPLTDEDVARILRIVDESDYEEVHIEVDDLRIDLRKSATSGASAHDFPQQAGKERSRAHDEPRATQAATAVPAEAEPVAREPVPEGAVIIRAPMVGTFYRAPSPGEEPFVEIGDTVDPDTTVCLVEVMKLFHSVKAGVAGTVRTIPVENGSMVKHGQTLMVIEPGVWRT